MRRVYEDEAWSQEGTSHIIEEFHSKKVTELAEDVLDECRAMLMMHHRFLDAALWHMDKKAASDEVSISTDGVNLHFDPMLAVMRYHDNPNEAVRDYLHLILHCIFRHPFDDMHFNEISWELACDVLVESLALDMASTRFPSELDDARREALSKLREICGSLNVMQMYRVFSEAMDGESGLEAYNEEFDEIGPYEEMIDDTTYAMFVRAAVDHISPERGLTTTDMYTLHDLFKRDSHEKWGTKRESSSQGNQGSPRQGDTDGSDTQETTGNAGEQDENEHDSKQDRQDQAPDQQDTEDQGGGEPKQRDHADEMDQETSDSSTSDKGSRPDSSETPDPLREAQLDQAEKEWEHIAKQMEMELESNRLWGSEAGELSQKLVMANRSKCDYEDFLRKFSALKEDIKTNEDEFDYIYYTYGLQRYGNMPLVEPLEYKEADRVREFVIAIDTSQSCEGELIATFVRRTFEIIKDTEVFGHQVNIHIVQCDAKVQCDDKIETADELDEWLKGFEVRGLGGTSFEPVFNYVDQLVENEEFSDLCGLIYFTDGMGSYPNRRPAYDAAFVFMHNAPTGVRVPPWAMKVVMTDDEVREL